MLMIRRFEELTIAVANYLRRYVIEGDIETLERDGLAKSDYRLLDDLVYWRKTHRALPAAEIAIGLNCPKIRMMVFN